MSLSPTSVLGVLVALSALTVGCGGTDETAPRQNGTAPGENGTATTPADHETPTPTSALDDAIAEARGLVADAAGVSEDAVAVAEASEVTWRDGALGCPQPDQVYTQALVEGYRLVMEADGEQFHVHGARGRSPFICQDPQEPQQS